MSSSKVDLSANVSYDKNVVEHVFKIETDECEVCKQKITKKRKHLLFWQTFVTHVRKDGKITWKELK